MIEIGEKIGLQYNLCSDFRLILALHILLSILKGGYQVLHLISEDQDAGGPHAWLALLMLLSVASAGPCPILSPLVASLKQLREHKLAQVQASAPAQHSKEEATPNAFGGVHSQLEEGYAGEEQLWIIAGHGAWAAVPALRAAIRVDCSRSTAPNVTVEDADWKASLSEGVAIVKALQQCRHRWWQGLLVGLAGPMQEGKTAFTGNGNL